jgi:hypothetical protein
MRAFDAVIAGIFFCSTAGVLLSRTLRAWRRFRMQERTTALLVEGVRILEERKEPAPTEPDEAR